MKKYFISVPIACLIVFPAYFWITNDPSSPHCIQVGELSSAIMQARQVGLTKKAVIAEIIKPEMPREVAQLIGNLIETAYAQSDFPTDKNIEFRIKDYGRKMEQQCNKK